MAALLMLTVWAFTGKAENFASRLFQWWLRLTILWIGVLILAEMCVAVSIVLQPDLANVFAAYLTLEAAAILAMVGPLALALVLIIAFLAVRGLIFVGLVIAALLGVIN